MVIFVLRLLHQCYVDQHLATVQQGFLGISAISEEEELLEIRCSGASINLVVYDKSVGAAKKLPLNGHETNQTQHK